MSDTFAFIGHPAYVGHLQRYLRWADPEQREINPQLLTRIFEWTPAYVAARVGTVRSRTGAERSGLFVVATIMPEMIDLSPQAAIGKIIAACCLADKERVRITTLGGLTSMAGQRAPAAVLGAVSNSVTTGNTLTVAMAVQQVFLLARDLGLNLATMNLTVLGGAGDIGGACADLLVPHFASVTVTGRDTTRLAAFAQSVNARHRRTVKVTTDNRAAVAGADWVIAATSATSNILDVSAFKPGAIVSDIGYPKNIRQLASDRDDIVVYLGGLCHLEQDIDLGFDIDLPRKDLLYGCFAEALVLDFEEKYCNYSMGRGNITPDKVDEMREAAERHGLRPAPPCQCGEFLSTQQLRAIVSNNTSLR